MNKIAKILLTLLLLGFVSTGSAYAADVLVELESPKSPTNQWDLSLTFVTLDVQDRPIAVRCYKKAPEDAGFVLFGPEFSLPAGGGSDDCKTDSTLVSTEGTYQFYVIATAGADTAQSNTVSVDFKSSLPGTPSYNGKEQTGSCQYKIKFRTADDSGKTVKLEVYRSDSTSFTADSGTRIATIGIGSDEESSYLNDVPDCGKTYYFAIRSFNDAGNGSDVVGDTKTITVAGPTPTTGAIAVATSGVSQASPTPTETKEEQVSETSQAGGQVLGEASPSDEVSPEPSLLSFLGSKKWLIAGGLLLVFFSAAALTIKKRRE